MRGHEEDGRGHKISSADEQPFPGWENTAPGPGGESRGVRVLAVVGPRSWSFPPGPKESASPLLCQILPQGGVAFKPSLTWKRGRDLKAGRKNSSRNEGRRRAAGACCGRNNLVL